MTWQAEFIAALEVLYQGEMSILAVTDDAIDISYDVPPESIWEAQDTPAVVRVERGWWDAAITQALSPEQGATEFADNLIEALDKPSGGPPGIVVLEGKPSHRGAGNR
jgi:hypothetical protein